MILPIFLTHFDIPARKWKESKFPLHVKRISRVVEKIEQTWLLQTKFTWLGFPSYDMLIVKQVLHLAVNGLSKQTDDETSSLSK